MGIVSIGTVRGSEIIENKDADEKSRMLQVEFTNPDDLQSIEQLGATGEDSNPQPGARVVVVDLAPSYRVAIALSDEVEPSVDAGEKEIYSYDGSGNKMVTIHLKVDGSLVIDNGSGSMELDASGNWDLNGNLTVAV